MRPLIQSILIVLLLLSLASVGWGSAQPADDGRITEPGITGLSIPAAEEVNQTSLRTVQLLEEMLAGATDEDRVRIVGETATCGLPSASDVIHKCLRDPSPLVVAEAVRTSRALGDDRLRGAVRQLITHPSAAVRREVVMAFGDDAELTATALNDPDRIVIAAALHRATPGVHAQALLRHLESDDPDLALPAITRFADPAFALHTDAIEKQLSRGIAFQTAALQTLASMKLRSMSPQMISLASSPHPSVRRAVIHLMASLEDPSTHRDFVRQALKDPDETVRTEAVRFLSADPSADLLPELLALLGDSYPPLRAEVIVVMSKLGEDAARAAAQLLQSGNPAQRQDASHLLGLLQNGAELEQHLALLNDPDLGVVAQACESLGRIGRVEAAARLFEVLQRDDLTDIKASPPAHRAASAAAVALGRLKHKPALPLLLRMVKGDPVVTTDLRSACTFAIGLSGDSEEVSLSTDLLAVYDELNPSPQLKIEAIKALGNLRAAPALEKLHEISRAEPDPAVRWMAHWAGARISGQSHPYSPPQRLWQAQVSVADAPDRDGSAGTVGLEARLHFTPQYLPGLVTPVQVTISNGTDQAQTGQVRLMTQGGALYQRAAVAPPHSRATTIVYATLPEQAGNSTENIATAEWVTSNGQRIARSEVRGQAVGSAEALTRTGTRGAVLLCLQDESGIGNAKWGDAIAFARQLSGVAGFEVAARAVPLEAMPRERAGYESVTYIALNGIDPDRLDLVQRQAMLQHLLSGGIMIVSPSETADAGTLARSWLAPHLPMRILGERRVDRLKVANGKRDLLIGEYVGAWEAIAKPNSPDRAAETQIVLRDTNYVHAASCSVGLGRVVFCGFPVNSLDLNDPEASRIWAALIGLDQSRPQWTGTELHASQRALIGSMLGFSSPSRSTALLLSAALISITLVGHLLCRGARRPRAFAVSVAVAGCVTLGLVAGRLMLSPAQTLAEARIVTVDISPEGGGLQQEVLAYAGSDQPDFELVSADSSVALTPAATTESDTQVIETHPFRAIGVGAKSGRIDQLWRTARHVDSEQYCDASISFTPVGLELSIRHNFPGGLNDVRLMGREETAFPGIPPGQTKTAPATGGAQGARSEAALLCQRISQAAMRRQGARTNVEETPPMLIGWLKDHAVPRQIRSSTAARQKQNILLRTPVRITTPASGQTVRVDRGFVRIVRSAGSGVPYDPRALQWLPSDRVGTWVFGVAVPAELGRVEPARIELKLDIAAPAHRVSLIRGLCREGRVDEASVGRELAHWSRPVSPQEIAFTCDGADSDESGTVWLALKVESLSTAVDAVPVYWTIKSAQWAMDATIP